MSLLTPFDPWKNKLCSCPAKYSLSAYTGCSHGCLYCYATSYIRDFYRARPKKDFLERLAREIKKVPSGSVITVANSSDPYMAQEKELHLTRRALQMLQSYDLKIHIVTKSALIVKDIDILKEYKNIVVSITLTTLAEGLSRKLEPGASTQRERLAALKKLSCVIPVAVRIDPLIYPLNTPEIKKMVRAAKRCGAQQIITSTYKAKPDNFKRMCRAFPGYKALWEKLYLKDGVPHGGYRYLAAPMCEKIINEVREAALTEGLLFSSCREGFTGLNTAACDGSSLFNPDFSLEKSARRAALSFERAGLTTPQFY